MMQHQLAIQARFCPEILERILRVTRHRGFQICALNMDQTTDSGNVSIELTVSSQRSINLLFSQLMKLVDVAGIEIKHKESQLISA
ncbi:acetolactate synthase 2 small subunit [Xenorhabdus nematophila]|uniref:Acetolactate synthase II, small subunit n=1 Tax=Xenorhabdus nematophila (strain ATCC 19061 / DSM 3370 / CCUG 14189 / LMG 1036 / NCIMB 9965 / AN6) TaxID=406817 RepID=D3VHV7_XENNA|nr:acetolactate synthase 2 small subunit [Xenorhabdus nematophila]CEE90118.1 acetolactate synthase II, small subunit [Xenorhabdus nematophila str. Anatoliense]CEF31658.1 acetolactate synthase II, small subunit [Xenorhabdus nematophila str. Websteri]AYA41419.1 acetolactate synthase 2 small subunit [Xenorhabdus nematophila]KHD29740.1 acetolactate synthase 2 regulatory subunit [Xenorhabdus nematophila]MBA0020158.1 acetolactate synthase 2 small subunit [Xenorhabdus nematophila]